MHNFCGRAIRDNKNYEKGNVTCRTLKSHSMMIAPWVIYHRAVFNRISQNGTQLHKPIKDPLPHVVVEVVQPLFDQLGDESFLVGCEKCYTQNRNESLYHVIWGMASKELYCSHKEICLAVSLGFLNFNQGFDSTHTQRCCLL